MKRLFVFVAILFMVSIQTPGNAQKMWNAEKTETATFDKWTIDIKEWLADHDITVAEIKGNLAKLVRGPKAGESGPKSSSEQRASSDLKAKDPSDFEKKVVELVNKERAKENLEPLKLHKRLSSLARKKSQDMATNNYFSHTSPTYGTPFDMMNQFNFSYRMAGENIAAGQRSPEQVVEGWMNSEGHRKNIMKDGFTHIGVGYIEGAGLPYGTYWTQLFMTPR